MTPVHPEVSLTGAGGGGDEETDHRLYIATAEMGSAPTLLLSNVHSARTNRSRSEFHPSINLGVGFTRCMRVLDRVEDGAMYGYPS